MGVQLRTCGGKKVKIMKNTLLIGGEEEAPLSRFKILASLAGLEAKICAQGQWSSWGLHGWDVTLWVGRAETWKGRLGKDLLPRVMVAIPEYEESLVADVFQGGADECITYQTGTLAFVARLQKESRLASSLRASFVDVTCFWSEGLHFDLLGHSMSYQGEQVGLGAREVQFLSALWRARSKVLTVDVLMETVWEMFAKDPNSLVANVSSRIHKKARSIGYPRKFILSVRGEGYRLAPSCTARFLLPSVAQSV